MLTAMEAGQPFERALAEMQAAGIAEADASLDVDGWDAAAKTAALANVLLGARMTPHDVGREGISPAAGARAVSARAAGRRLKLVAAAARDTDGVTARVGLQELGADDLLSGLDRQQNGIIFSTDLLGEFAIVQRGSGLTQTAYALLSDLIAIERLAGEAAALPGRAQRAFDRGRIVAFDHRVADDRHRNRAQATGEQLVVCALVFVDVLRGKRDAFS